MLTETAGQTDRAGGFCKLQILEVTLALTRVTAADGRPGAANVYTDRCSWTLGYNTNQDPAIPTPAPNQRQILQYVEHNS